MDEVETGVAGGDGVGAGDSNTGEGAGGGIGDAADGDAAGDGADDAASLPPRLLMGSCIGICDVTPPLAPLQRDGSSFPPLPR